MPLLTHIPLAADVRLGLWHISETASALRSSLRRPDLAAEATAGLKAESQREREVLAVRCLLRAMMGEEQRLDHDADGRPRLVSQPETCLSVSHTLGYAAVILAPRPVGIDIERIGQRVERVVSHFLQPAEQALLATTLELHLAWSTKEAAYKVLGKAYYDLKRLTRITRVHYLESAASPQGVPASIPNVPLRCRGEISLDVAEREPLSVRFLATDAFVLTWTA